MHLPCESSYAQLHTGILNPGLMLRRESTADGVDGPRDAAAPSPVSAEVSLTLQRIYSKQGMGDARG